MGQQEMKTNEELLKEINQLKEKVSELEKTKFQTNIWLENSPVCIKIVDLDFNLQYMSRYGADELKVDDVITFYGNPYPFSFYPDSSKIIILENLNRAKKTGNTINQEVPIKDCEGNTIWHHSTITPVNNNQGELDHIQITSLNTTHSKQAETALEESYERFRLVFNQQFQFMAILSPEGYTLEINDLPLKEQGAKREDYIGKVFWKSPTWENNTEMQDRVKNQILKASSMQEPLFAEDTFLSEDGSLHTALATYHAIRDAENNVRHILVQATDITERKNAEAALLKSETTVRNKLKAITDPEGNIDMLELSDIIDVEVLQSIMDDFYQITGMVAAVLDVSGKVLVAVGWQDICTKFHRCNPDSLKNCLESDTILTKGVPKGTCKAYRCKNNMWDIVTPIMIGERHLGNVFMGQYFLEGEVPDVELFRKQAKKYGFDEEEYLKALKKVPHIAKETVEIGMQFYSKLAGLISTLSYSAIKQSKLLSERKLAEEALLKSEEKYRELISLAQEGIWVIDKNNATSFVNPSMAKMLGYSSEEMLGKSLFDFMDEKGIQIANENLERRQSGVKEQHDFEFICKNGDRIITAIEAAPIMDSKGEYDGAIAGLINITERKLAEDKIRKLSTVVEQSPTMVVITGTEGDLEYVNPKFIEFTGYSSAEAIGARSNILKSGTHEKSFYTELWNIVKSGKTWRGRFYNKKKNGECFWESASISAILDESGKIINYIKIGEDITQQRNTEIELKNAMEKAVESDRLKSAFLANMSHEIRTPMNGILGFINLLNAPNLSKEKIDKYSDIINKSGDRLLTTINDIIDISKIEAGQMHVSKREVSINNLMEELHSFHSSEANQNGLSLILKPLVSKDITILTDDDKLYGMLTNLIKNAIKYTEQGSITFGCVVKDKAIQFYVEDTGIGIPKERLHAVFNRFEKADIEEISAFEGSGLGLAISKAYAEMLGGEIFVESEEGKGSKFMFSMPHVSAIKNELEQVDKDNNRVQLRNDKLNLLIVEDDMVSAELLKTLLDDMFHKITHVQSGIDAVEVCKNESEIDLVLMDVKMPVMNGYKATQQIRSFNKDLIIIAQTAYAMLEDKGKALQAGCNDYITKPINKKVLFEMINKHLG